MADVSAKMLDEFAQRLEADVLSQGSASEPEETVSEAPAEANGAAESTDSSPVRAIHSVPAEPVDLLGTAGPSVAKRIAPLAAGLILLLVWSRLRRRRRLARG